MTTDPTTLLPSVKTCPKDCPFLGGRGFIPDILPYYCDKYDQFLGADEGKRTLRCGPCLGQVIATVQQGLSLIEAYTLPLISIPETKEAFVKMNASFQRMFVELVKKTGHQVAIPFGEQASPGILSGLLLKQWKEAQEMAGSPEVKEFKAILGDLAGDLPNMLDKQTQNLLSNLFQVLDSSEKAMLKEVLTNPRQAESFLEQVKGMNKDNSLLKNFRLKLYEYDEDERRRQLMRDRVQTRAQGMEGIDKRQQRDLERQQRQQDRDIQMKEAAEKVHMMQMQKSRGRDGR